MRIDQVVVGASVGDAVTTAALNMRALLRDVGASDLYGRYIDTSLQNDVLELKNFDRVRRDPKKDVLIFHASIGDSKITEFLFSRPEKIVLIYHNISPASAFAEYDAHFANSLERGRELVSNLREVVSLALADSAFNAEELTAMGYEDVRVSPLLLDIGELLQTASDWETSNHLENVIEGPIILNVAQLLPHKRPDLLLQSFHILSTYLRQDANLVMVGPNRIPEFGRYITELKDELNLNKVWMAGAVNQHQLVSFYRAADMFATVSDHEGFCVPLIEAMRFRLPIVARGTSAIPETLGDAGIVLPANTGPELIAEAMCAMLESEDLRQKFRVRGEARGLRYSFEFAQQNFLENLLSVA